MVVGYCSVISSAQSHAHLNEILSVSEPEIINGFVALATNTGEWRYFRPDSVEQFHFVPVVAQGEYSD